MLPGTTHRPQPLKIPRSQSSLSRTRNECYGHGLSRRTENRPSLVPLPLSDDPGLTSAAATGCRLYDFSLHLYYTWLFLLPTLPSDFSSGAVHFSQFATKFSPFKIPQLWLLYHATNYSEGFFLLLLQLGASLVFASMVWRSWNLRGWCPCSGSDRLEHQLLFFVFP